MKKTYTIYIICLAVLLLVATTAMSGCEVETGQAIDVPNYQNYPYNEIQIREQLVPCKINYEYNANYEEIVSCIDSGNYINRWPRYRCDPATRDITETKFECIENSCSSPKIGLVGSCNDLGEWSDCISTEKGQACSFFTSDPELHSYYRCQSFCSVKGCQMQPYYEGGNCGCICFLANIHSWLGWF